MIRRHLRELSVALALAVLLVVVAMRDLTHLRFYSEQNVHLLLLRCAIVLVAAVGMTLVILARQIDISIGSQLSLGVILAGLLATADLPWPMVALLVLLAGGLMGALNGMLVAGLGLPSIVVTLATMVIGRESLRWWRGGQSVLDLPSSFQWFGAGQDAGEWLVVGVAVAVWLVFALGLRYLAAGRAIYATGSDPEAARLAGIRPRRVVFGVFVVMGILTGVAALLHTVRFVGVQPSVGEGLELEVIAAVVVGGTAVSGGRGTLLGTFLGVALLVTIGPALVHLGVSAHWDKAVQGAIILMAVASDSLSRRTR
jgi:rhamnose transport system permease protein